MKTLLFVTLSAALLACTGAENNDCPTGPRGPRGSPGLQGRSGYDGMDGRDGYDGVNGMHGRDGLDGMDGMHGQKGDPGEATRTVYSGDFDNTETVNIAEIDIDDMPIIQAFILIRKNWILTNFELSNDGALKLTGNQNQSYKIVVLR